MKKIIRRAGFWHSEGTPNLPVPEARDKPWKGRKEFMEKLHALEESFGAQKPLKGFDICQICEKKLTMRAHMHNGWEWAASLYHYVEKHNVKPQQSFIDFIMNEGTRPGMPKEPCDKTLVCVESKYSRLIKVGEGHVLVLSGMHGELIDMKPTKVGPRCEVVVRWFGAVGAGMEVVRNVDDVLSPDQVRYVGRDPVFTHRPCYDRATDSARQPDLAEILRQARQAKPDLLDDGDIPF